MRSAHFGPTSQTEHQRPAPSLRTTALRDQRLRLLPRDVRLQSRPPAKCDRCPVRHDHNGRHAVDADDGRDVVADMEGATPWPWTANMIGFYIPVDRHRDQATRASSGSAAPWSNLFEDTDMSEDQLAELFDLRRGLPG